MEAPVYRAWAKAIRADAGPPGYSANWIAARRGWLKVFKNRIECGSALIPTEAVLDAVLYETRQWFIPVDVLAVSTPDGTWPFGLNPWTNIAPHLPFPFRRERVRLKYSRFSIAVRIALFAFVAYWLYRRWIGA